MGGRLVYRDWTYGIGRKGAFESRNDSELGREIVQKVRDAVARLAPLEREFVQMYWFEGRPLTQLSRLFGKRLENLDGLNRRILKKLKRLLSEYVTERFGIEDSIGIDCAICNHPRRREIDEVLLARKPEETCRPVCRELRIRFGLTISTPQVIIGHVKYHVLPEEGYAG